MQRKPLSPTGVLLGLSFAAAACGGVSDRLGNPPDGGVDVLSPAEGGAIVPPDAGGSTTCGAAVACGPSGATYEECTEVSASGACAAIVYQVSSGKSFTCTGCSSCEGSQQALSAYCASGPAGDAGSGEDSGHDGSAGGGADAEIDAGHSDATAPDASADTGSDVGVDAAGCIVGETRCVGPEIELCGSDGAWGPAESDPIWAVEASAAAPDGTITVMNYDGDDGDPAPTATGVAPDGAPVTFQVWTAPGVSSLSVMYWLNGDYQNIYSVPLTIAYVTDLGLDAWTGAFPAQSSGTTVTWWAQGTDVCHTGTDYYSNAGNNYVYTTP